VYRRTGRYVVTTVHGGEQLGFFVHDSTFDLEQSVLPPVTSHVDPAVVDLTPARRGITFNGWHPSLVFARHLQ